MGSEPYCKNTTQAVVKGRSPPLLCIDNSYSITFQRIQSSHSNKPGMHNLSNPTRKAATQLCDGIEACCLSLNHASGRITRSKDGIVQNAKVGKHFRLRENPSNLINGVTRKERKKAESKKNVINEKKKEKSILMHARE